MSRKAKVYMNELLAGILSETDYGFAFEYDENYINWENNLPISLTLPIEKKVFKSRYMFPFFDGLIPEGWLLEIAEKNWKINPKDRMGLLMVCCKDCIGAVSIIPMEEI